MREKFSLPTLPCVSFRASVLVAFFLLLVTSRTDAQSTGIRAGSFVYTGNNDYPGTSNNLVNGYAINPASGTLTTVAGSPFAAGGQVLAIVSHPSGRFVYVATTGSEDSAAVAAFTVDSLDGALTPVPGSPYAVGQLPPLAWGTLLAIDPAGKFLYVAGGNNLYGFAIDATTGELSALLGGSSLSIGAASVAIDPSGKYLIAWGNAASSSYAINGTTGALTLTNSGNGCGGPSMLFEPSGHFLYATGYEGGIAACGFDSGSGALAAVTGSPLDLPAAGYFSGIAVHPSGAFVYASVNDCVDSGPGNYLYGYLIDPTAGELTAIDGSPFALPGGEGCYYDYGVATEASGNFVYTVDANYGTAAYTVNQTTGALTLASSTFSGPGAEIVTTAPNAMSASATVTGVQIAPSSAQIITSTLGAQYQFTLAATFSDGSTGFLTGSATWTSSNTSVATVASGLATSTGYGTTTITATVGGQSATASLTVAEPALSNITVAPSTVTVYKGTAIQLTATGEYTDGSSVDVTGAVTWSSSNTSVATVSTAGLVQSIGLGTATISATLQSITDASAMTVVPPFAWNTPAPITYGAALGSAQLDATSGVSGTYTYNPPSGTVLPAGPQSLNVVFTPDVSASASASVAIASSKGKSRRVAASKGSADPGYSLAATATVTLLVNQAALSVTANNQSMSYGSAVPTLTGMLTGVVAGDGITASYFTTATSTSAAGSYPITAKLNDPTSKLSNYAVTNSPGTLTIGMATPTINWVAPPAITYGTALGASQLNASSTVAGSFTYSPAGGAVLTAGSRTLSVVFTPTDSTDYAIATATVSITVNQATPTVVWATPGAIAVGTALGSAQLDASASVPGTFVYTPGAGTIPPIGSDSLSVLFTPTDATDYTTAAAKVTIAVIQPLPVLGSLSPSVETAGGAAFTLTVNGSGLTSTSMVYWGTTSLATQYVNSAQVTAQVPALDIASAGIGAVTVQNPTPGGGTSNSLQFEIDSSNSGTPPNFTTLTATVTPGATASYPVTLPSTATDVSVACLNLPTGATCSYSATTGAVTIATTATTPAGTYQITVVFTETLPGASAAFAMFPILLLPLFFIRRRLIFRKLWFVATLAAILSVAFIGCGGPSSPSNTQTTQSHQATSSGTVTLTVQ